MTKTYTHYYQPDGEIVIISDNKKWDAINLPSFDRDTKLNIATHRYNIQTSQVEPKN